MNPYRKMASILLLMALVFALAAPRVTHSQADLCPQIVARALDATDAACGAAGRNEACYGYMMVDAQAQPDVDDFTFNQVGDLEDVADIRVLRLSGMDEKAGWWGVALLRLRASLPDEDQSKNVTLLVFGDVAVENDVSDPPALDITAPTNLSVRNMPSLESTVIANLAKGSTAVVNGRSTDGEWLRVVEPAGWIYASVVMTPTEVAQLAAADTARFHYQPMQAFYFQSGADDAACPEAPNSGLVIQTPQGVGRVTFLINEVDIQLGSTVYFQAQPGGVMTVTVVEGEARVSAAGVSSRAEAGSYVTIPISADLRPAGPPSKPMAYDMASVQALPIQGLDRPVEVHAPLTDAELATLVDEITTENEVEAASSAASSAASPSTEDGANGREPVPGGGTINNPIFGENTPGHGGVPPGQEKKN